MQTENLNTKNIWEFNEGDTIYIPVREKSTGNNHYFLCQFQNLVHNTVYGKILEVERDASWCGVKVGDSIYNDFKKCSLFGLAKNDNKWQRKNQP